MDSQPEQEQQPQQPRSYWKRWTKHDFFPEPTFHTMTSYKAAVSDTPSRLKDRLLHRSSDSFELLHLPKQSQFSMKRCLSWWDLLFLSFGSVVGSGIFVITGQATLLVGPAILLSYVISGASALLSVLCYAEFAVEVPVAGGSFSYLRIELGDFVAFIAAGNILLEAVVGAAGLGRSWTSYLASMVNSSDVDFLRIKVSSLPDGFNLLDPVAVLVLLVCNGIAVSGTARTSLLNLIASVLSALVILFIIVVGFIYGKTENLVPFFPYGAEGVFKASALVYWSYTGFDMVANLAEEVKQPSKDIPVGLIGGMSLITVVYCLMSLALVMMQKYTEISADAAFSVAFAAIGLDWGKYLVSVCALKGMTTSLLVGSLGQARYTTQIARSHMISPWFALVHPKTGTPIYATILVTMASAVVAFFTSLDVLSSVFSFSTLSIFMCVAIALLVRRYYVRDVTAKRDLFKFLASLFVIIGSSIAIAALWNTDVRGWVPYVVAGVVWISGTLWMALLPKQRVAKVWSVPLVPWLPALSIGINLFLIGSLGYVAFLRFAICTAVMIIYYLFVGVHATYDVAHQIDEQYSTAEEGSTS